MLAGGEGQGDQHQEEEEAQGGEEGAGRVPDGLHHWPQRAHLLPLQPGLLRRDDWLRQLWVQNRVVSLQLCGTDSQAQGQVVLPALQRRQAQCEKDRQMMGVWEKGMGGRGGGCCLWMMPDIVVQTESCPQQPGCNSLKGATFFSSYFLLLVLTITHHTMNMNLLLLLLC